MTSTAALLAVSTRKGLGVPDGWHERLAAHEPRRALKRQCLVVDGGDPVGLYLGTTNGEVWSSNDEGETFSRLAGQLPHIYAITVGTTA